MELIEIEWSGVDWIVLARDRDKWMAVMNSVMIPRVHKILGNYRTATMCGLSSGAWLHKFS
jgi:hypothetical protein